MWTLHCISTVLSWRTAVVVCVYTVVFANQTNEPTSSYIATKGLLGSQKLKILLRVYRAVCTVESG